MLTSNIVFFPCKNLMDTQEFYSCVVGISVHRKMDNSIIFDSGYGYLGFCKYSDDRPMANGVCISFNCTEQGGCGLPLSSNHTTKTAMYHAAPKAT